MFSMSSKTRIGHDFWQKVLDKLSLTDPYESFVSISLLGLDRLLLVWSVFLLYMTERQVCSVPLSSICLDEVYHPFLNIITQERTHCHKYTDASRIIFRCILYTHERCRALWLLRVAIHMPPHHLVNVYSVMALQILLKCNSHQPQLARTTIRDDGNCSSATSRGSQ